MRKCSCLLIILFLVSCNTIETHYGGSAKQSINGSRILKAVWTDALDLQFHRYRSDKLDKADLLIHFVEDIQFNINDNGFDLDDLARIEEDNDWDDQIDLRSHAQWIRDWLNAGKKRQFVLILRDGNVAPQLCNTWADELEASIKNNPGNDKNEELQLQVDELRKLALANFSTPLVEYPDSEDFYFFSVHGREAQQAQQVEGIYNGPAPATLRTRSSLSAKKAKPLFVVDRRNFGIEVPFKSSRLIIIANATAMLDAALVDHHARNMLNALTEHIQGWEHQHGVWLHHPYPRSHTPEPPNVLAMLFSQKPFNYIIIHAFVFLFAFLFWKACWLGRKRSRRRAVQEQFDRHVEALAFQLSKQKDYTGQHKAIARAAGKETNYEAIANDAEAIASIQNMYDEKHKG